MNIQFIRGDDHEERFRFKTFNDVIEQIYFTVKNNMKFIKIKKKLNEGITLKNDGWYYLTFVPEDTDGLACEEMVYDIEIITNGLKYTVQKGRFILEEDVTTPDCEV